MRVKRAVPQTYNNTYCHKAYSIFPPGSAATNESHEDDDAASAKQQVCSGSICAGGQQTYIVVSVPQCPHSYSHNT